MEQSILDPLKNSSLFLSTFLRRTLRVRRILFYILAACLFSASGFQPTVTVVLLGDVMLGRGVAQSHADGHWEDILQTLAPVLRAADFAAANLESPLVCTGDPAEGRYTLVAPVESATGLEVAGLDILSLANNHAGDAGPDGIRCTESILQSRGISMLSPRAKILEVRKFGLSIAFLGWDMVGSSTDPIILLTAVEKLRTEGRLVIVSMHWGIEHQAGADPMQKEMAARLIEAGATIVWGHHPHIVQAVDRRGSALILYSLGNAVFDQSFPASARRGMLFRVVLDRFGVREAASVLFDVDPRNGQAGSIDIGSLRIYPASGKN
jgi:poly-gamma-glutamate synthesis protein (capsule biosynthesis protein)